MRLYQFVCSECGAKDELFRRLTESAHSFCKACERGVMIRVITAPHLHGSKNMPNG